MKVQFTNVRPPRLSNAVKFATWGPFRSDSAKGRMNVLSCRVPALVRFIPSRWKSAN